MNKETIKEALAFITPNTYSHMPEKYVEAFQYMEKAALKQLKEENPDANVVEFTAFKAGFLTAVNEYGISIITGRTISLMINKLFKRWKNS